MRYSLTRTTKRQRLTKVERITSIDEKRTHLISGDDDTGGSIHDRTKRRRIEEGLSRLIWITWIFTFGQQPLNVDGVATTLSSRMTIKMNQSPTRTMRKQMTKLGPTRQGTVTNPQIQTSWVMKLVLTERTNTNVRSALNLLDIQYLPRLPMFPKKKKNCRGKSRIFRPSLRLRRT